MSAPESLERPDPEKLNHNIEGAKEALRRVKEHFKHQGFGLTIQGLVFLLEGDVDRAIVAARKAGIRP